MLHFRRRNLELVLGCFILVHGMLGTSFSQRKAASGTDRKVQKMASSSNWRKQTASKEGVTIERTHPIGGRFDLIGNGALLLRKQNQEEPFYASTAFHSEGTWTSRWLSIDGNGGVTSLRIQYWVYGQKQEMDAGWTKFSGNPLITRKGWKHTTGETLLLSNPAGKSADQSLAKGAGKWSGKWLLFFNIAGYADKGWGMAVADSLAPLKKGKNPFERAEPYPLITGEEQKNASEYARHAPNDFMYVERDSRWYAPDETDGGPSHMWSAVPDADRWTLEGPIKGLKGHGHDPGMVFDGEMYHLFTEKGERINHLESEHPTDTWTHTGPVLDVGGHTGDADLSFFNNRWHMIYDDAPHTKYKLGYAWTTPEEFPEGWREVHQVFGPHKPEQNQLWDNFTDEGNGFGTGDGDIGLEGKTLYLSYEFPTGIAYREMSVLDGSGQRVRVKLFFDMDGDEKTDRSTGWSEVEPGKSRVPVPASVSRDKIANVRIRIGMQSDHSEQSPVIRKAVLER